MKYTERIQRKVNRGEDHCESKAASINLTFCLPTTASNKATLLQRDVTVEILVVAARCKNARIAAKKPELHKNIFTYHFVHSWSFSKIFYRIFLWKIRVTNCYLIMPSFEQKVAKFALVAARLVKSGHINTASVSCVECVITEYLKMDMLWSLCGGFQSSLVTMICEMNDKS